VVYQDEEHQKRLTAFERAGVENYLYWKRCEEENKIDKKADNMIQRYRPYAQIAFWCGL